MPRTTRLTTVLTLLVAFLVAGLVPAAGSWSCPDGTACVFTAGRGFHCAGDQCQLACCAVEAPGHGCSQCEHGAFPGVGARSASQGRTVREADQCLYWGGAQLDPIWTSAPAFPHLHRHVVAVLPAPVAPPVTASLWERLFPVRGSPPAPHLPPSASPRAPPGPDCV
jgi:hypothetical protein